MKYIDVNIHKPLGGTYVAIRDIYIKQAIREGKWLRITIPQGVGEHDPKAWVKTGKRVEQVFKIPDHPMKLIRNYVIVGQTYKNPVKIPPPMDFNTALANTPTFWLNKMREALHR